MNVFSIILFCFLAVIILGILHKLAVRRAQYLVEMELQSSATNPFADILLPTAPTQQLSETEPRAPREEPCTPFEDDAPDRQLSIKPALLTARHEHAPSS